MTSLTLLDLRIATDKVVKTLDARLCAVDGECEVVVLEVQTDSREVDDGLDASCAKLLWVANTRALEDKRRGQRATRHNDLLASFEGASLELIGVKRLRRASFCQSCSSGLKILSLTWS